VRARRQDPRLREPRWSAAPPAGHRRLAVRALLLLGLPLAAWYFGWLLQPERVGHPMLFGLLVAAELFNLVQAVGFWWTASTDKRSRPVAPLGRRPEVDVLVPVYGEPLEVVEPTLVLAASMADARVRVHLLDDGGDDAMEALARRTGAFYHRRAGSAGAKAGNINAALARTSGEFVVILDCDHVPSERFLSETLGHMSDERVAFVQTPQYYANHEQGAVARAAWGQQALFFGAIARGKGTLGSIFCCGTNVLFRRSALEQVGGFPTHSVTEDFELSVELHQRGWRSVYVPEVLASGLGPEDMASYVSQQQRWARGCLAGARSVLRARLPRRVRAQYLLSSMYFLSGWTLLIYMTFPVVRILTGAQPIAAGSADQFLIHFVPYFLVALGAVAAAGAGAYTFAAFALSASTFWIHVQATLRALTGRRGGFVVTPKEGQSGRQPLAVVPALAAVAVLIGVAGYGLVKDRSPSTLNNIAFASLHIGVLLAGAWPALRGAAREAPAATERLVAAREAARRSERRAA
jgi:cellulose synthase/poly-beta-1,6-N-acetylglucosamine synthase-like glycosyltransferase